MGLNSLQQIQAPLKERYRDDPVAARVTLSASGALGEGVTCSVQTGQALVRAGLHPGTGGDGLSACSGDMLLQALVACAGVTMGAVATSLGIEVSGTVTGKATWTGEEPCRSTGTRRWDSPTSGCTSTFTRMRRPSKLPRSSGSPSAIASSIRPSNRPRGWPHRSTRPGLLRVEGRTPGGT